MRLGFSRGFVWIGRGSWSNPHKQNGGKLLLFFTDVHESGGGGGTLLFQLGGGTEK